MQVEALKALVMLQSEGSIATVARTLGKSASQVGVWLTNLEADLGIALVDRHGYRAELTAQGAFIARHANDVVTQLSEIDRKISERRSVKTESLNISMLDVMPVSPFKDALWQVDKLSPTLKLDFGYASTQETLEGVIKGTIDFGVVFYNSSIYPDISSRLIGYTQIVTVVAPDHPLALEQQNFCFEDLISHLQLLPQSYLGFGIDQVSKYSENYWLMNNIDMTLALLQRGVGWAELPHHVVEPYLKSGKLTQLKTEGESPLWWPIQLVWQRHRPIDKHSAWLIEKFSSPKPGLAISGLTL